MKIFWFANTMANALDLRAAEGCALRHSYSDELCEPTPTYKAPPAVCAIPDVEFPAIGYDDPKVVVTLGDGEAYEYIAAMYYRKKVHWRRHTCTGYRLMNYGDYNKRGTRVNGDL